jgi:hypothetical protein
MLTILCSLTIRKTSPDLSQSVHTQKKQVAFPPIDYFRSPHFGSKRPLPVQSFDEFLKLQPTITEQERALARWTGDDTSGRISEKDLETEAKRLINNCTKSSDMPGLLQFLVKPKLSFGKAPYHILYTYQDKKWWYLPYRADNGDLRSLAEIRLVRLIQEATKTDIYKLNTLFNDYETYQVEHLRVIQTAIERKLGWPKD